MHASVSEMEKDIQKSHKCCLLAVPWLKRHARHQHLLRYTKESILLILKERDLGKEEQMQEVLDRISSGFVGI